MPRTFFMNLPCSKTKLSWEQATTVILRNIPNNCSQSRLLSEMSNAGFGGTFDFFYLPCDFETSANKGYAFVNFKIPATTLSFRNFFHGRKLPNFKSQKVIQIEIASVQGFKANYDHFKDKHDLLTNIKPEFQPIFVFDPLPAKISLESATSFASSPEFWHFQHDLYPQHEISEASIPAKVTVPDISSLDTVYGDSASEAASADTDDEVKGLETLQKPFIVFSREDSLAALYRFSF
jgi:hypothetical protein